MAIVGEEFPSNNYGKFKVLEKDGRNDNGAQLFKIRFLDTGFETSYRKSSIKRGSVKDCFVPTVAGVGYLGHATPKDDKKIYNLWMRMIHRCYNQNSQDYSDYGELGVTVGQRWQSLENFLNGLPELDGFDEKRYRENRLVLTFTEEQMDLEPQGREYSPDNCKFVSRSAYFGGTEDVDEAYEIEGRNPNTGEWIAVPDIKEFAEEHEMIPNRIRQCLSAFHDQHSHFDWIFRYKNPKELPDSFVPSINIKKE